MRYSKTIFLISLYLSAYLLQFGCNGQDVPPIPCPQYFEYLRTQRGTIGRITLPLNQQVSELSVKFSQRYPIESNYYGSLTLYDDEEVTKENLRVGNPIRYRVDFPTPGVLPKLISLELNGELICAGREYPAPSTMINLMHTLRSTIVFTPNANPSFNGIGSNFDPSEFFYFDSNRRRTTQQPMQSERPFSSTNPFFDLNSRPRVTSTISASRPGAPPTTTLTTTPAPAPAAVPTQVRQPAEQPSQPSQPPPAISRVQPQTTSNNVFNTCGREGNSIVPFIHMGSVLARGQFPWLTAIYQKQTSAGLKFICGGSLISRRTVITAAHCFKLTSLTANRVLVYLGRHNLDDYSEEGIAAREVAELLSHPQYDTNTYPDADLALVHLQVPVEFTTFIQPICLWSETYPLQLPARQKGFVAGWGGDENGAAVTNLPKMIDAEIVNEADCLRSLQVKDLTSNRTLCAGNRDGSGPCMGDSGGGLMLNYNNVWVLRAIVSAGQLTDQRTCNLREFVIYCDVAKHITWVRQNVRN